jgi:hypothetical protein
MLAGMSPEALRDENRSDFRKCGCLFEGAYAFDDDPVFRRATCLCRHEAYPSDKRIVFAADVHYGIHEWEDAAIASPKRPAP